MPCYHPLDGFQLPSGKLTKNYRPGLKHMTVPCGQCIGCRLDRSRSWAIRCVHEAQLYEENCFITLTYSPEHLPETGSLVVSDYQQFMKRLRKHFAPRKIRFFQCGEYGDQNLRPHYHACLFNIDFHDKTLWKTANGNNIYTSNTLSKIWPFGFSTIGAVTFQSAGYTARYIMKKVTGDEAPAKYERTNTDTGEIITLKKEYTTMSRRPGLGYDWFQKYKADLYPHDYVIIDGKKHPIPRYYDLLLERENPDLLESIKSKREAHAELRPEEQTCDRLRVRETVQKHKLKRLPRAEV